MSRTSGATSLTTSERVVLALVRAARASRVPTMELREAVCAYVRELKGRGYPPERALAAVKALVAEGGITRKAWAGRDEAVIDPENEVVDHVVTWCIEEYFAPPREDR